MFKSYYDNLKITETDLTKSALRRLRMSSAIASLAIPLMFVGTSLMSGIGSLIVLVISLVCSGFLFAVLLNRPLNTMSRTDKNLDEWEITLKRKAESFSYRILTWSLAFGLLSILAVNLFLDFFTSVSTIHTAVPLTLDDLFWLVMFVYMTAVLLPILHVAWTAKPLDTEDDPVIVTAKPGKGGGYV